MTFIDAHTHYPIKKGRAGIFVEEDAFGTHPWALATSFHYGEWEREWEKKTKGQKTFGFVGECGLDRARPGLADIEDQKKVLLKHFELAEELQRPIILHVVRAFSDLLYLLKKTSFSQNILLHDYSGNEQEMKELLRYKSFFSYGARIFKDDKKLKATPRERLLLETDDQTAYSIEDIYAKASSILHLPEKELVLLLEKNFLRYGGNLEHVSPPDVARD